MKFKKCASILLSATLALGICAINPSTPEAIAKAEILSGSNRYSTAVAVSKKGWDYADNVILVNDSAIADALAATPLADELNAPILLTGKNKLNNETRAEISRLGAKNIYLIGGKSVLSENLLSEIDGNVYRISGDSREKTALEIAKKIQELKPIKTIAVVNGKTGLADAVSIAAIAAEKDMAIILSNPKSGVQDSATFLNSIGIEKSYVIGGDKAVSNSIMATLPNSERISGLNRNDTNAAVIKKFYNNSNLNNLYVAKNGSGAENQLIDALAVGVLAAKNNSPVLIVSNKLSNRQHDVVKSKDINIVTRVGGNGNESAFEEVKELQGIKPAELKLPSEMLCSWYIKYRSPDVKFDSYKKFFEFKDGYRIDDSNNTIKYKVVKISGNEYYLDLYYPENMGGTQKAKYVLNGDALTYYFEYNGKYVEDVTLYKGITPPDYLYRGYYRDDDVCLSIDSDAIKIFGKEYNYDLSAYRYPGYNDFIFESNDNGEKLYFYVHQWGNKVGIYYVSANNYNSYKPENSDWNTIAIFSTSPLSSEILGDIENLLPGMNI